MTWERILQTRFHRRIRAIVWLGTVHWRSGGTTTAESLQARSWWRLRFQCMQRGLRCQDRVDRRCSSRTSSTNGIEIYSGFRITREHAGFVLVANVFQPFEIFIEN